MVGGFLPGVKQIANVAALPGWVAPYPDGAGYPAIVYQLGPISDQISEFFYKIMAKLYLKKNLSALISASILYLLTLL